MLAANDVNSRQTAILKDQKNPNDFKNFKANIKVKMNWFF